MSESHESRGPDGLRCVDCCRVPLHAHNRNHVSRVDTRRLPGSEFVVPTEGVSRFVKPTSAVLPETALWVADLWPMLSRMSNLRNECVPWR